MRADVGKSTQVRRGREDRKRGKPGAERRKRTLAESRRCQAGRERNRGAGSRRRPRTRRKRDRGAGERNTPHTDQ
ncbi:hypothetical protein NDU88_011922 [Pleurodeles waltl]|uniref:Uncharacterized protein n=1 Tax=Pleurodeles waltl TaxID=8319 RepID=A0AAV7S2N4_PLEWA|nr:hypothetical protein NDU88_011922 [Pleurodeles waltl]